MSPEACQVDRSDKNAFDVIRFKNVFAIFLKKQYVFDAFNVFDVLRFVLKNSMVLLWHMFCVFDMFGVFDMFDVRCVRY